MEDTNAIGIVMKAESNRKIDHAMENRTRIMLKNVGMQEVKNLKG